MVQRSGPEDLDLDALLPPFRATDPAVRWLFGLERLGMRPGLERIEALLRGCGRPERACPAVVVAGTNGKGTAATYLAALSRAAGRRTGLYTSPHFLRVHERILIDGAPISEAALAGLIQELRPAAERLGATFFETITAMALLHFAREGVELAVLETGLGGRLDATNAVPAVGALLTSVGADHQHVLGESLAEIATEKLGLAKAGRPFYLGPLSDDLRALARRRLAEAGAEAVDLGGLPPHAGHLAQRGRNQARLAGMARACYEDLARRHGWPEPDYERALAQARVPCRYEILGRDPELILDPAHNAPALATLLAQWEGEAAREDRILVLGVMRDKRIDEVLGDLRRAAATLLVTAPRWYRSQEPGVLGRQILAAPGEAEVEIRVMESVRLALEEARRRARARTAAGGRPSVLVTGSNFLVAEALDRLGVDDIHEDRRPGAWDEGRPLRARVSRPEEGAMA